MVEPGNTPQLREIYRLAKENNEMLHSMRRQAFWGGMFRLALYALAIGVPIWLYFNYLAPIVKQMDAALSQATGRQVQLENQFGDWQRLYDQLKSALPGGSTSSTSKQ